MKFTRNDFRNAIMSNKNEASVGYYKVPDNTVCFIFRAQHPISERIVFIAEYLNR